VNTGATPAAQGSVIILYGTGGAVTLAATTGGIASGAANQELPVVVGLALLLLADGEPFSMRARRRGW
jgi:uncharacterized protein (TIGR03437 family)